MHSTTFVFVLVAALVASVVDAISEGTPHSPPYASRADAVGWDQAIGVFGGVVFVAASAAWGAGHLRRRGLGRFDRICASLAILPALFVAVAVVVEGTPHVIGEMIHAPGPLAVFHLTRTIVVPVALLAPACWARFAWHPVEYV